MSKDTPKRYDPAQTKLRILVVDDEPQVRDMLCRLLGAVGHDCQSACNGAQAWEILQAVEIQIMVLDLTLPGESGLDLLSRVKAVFGRCEVIMLTAIQETRPAIQALSLGASAYLIKPVEREELLFHIDRAAERRQLEIDRDVYMHGLEERVREQTREVQDAHEETIHRLMAASRYRDEETGAHIRRVGLLSEALAGALGWPAEQIDRIRMAAPMHDVGKIGIPDAILQKPGKLNPQEFEIMKTHALIGARMLSGSNSPVLQMAEQIACSHHERWDATGYPHGLASEAIPECARVVAVVDVFDALTHDRVYRPALGEHEALAILESGRGTHFDPSCVARFMEILPLIRQISQENSDNLEDDLGATNYQDYLPKILNAPAGVPASRAPAARPSVVPLNHLPTLAGSAL